MIGPATNRSQGCRLVAQRLPQPSQNEGRFDEAGLRAVPDSNEGIDVL
jgi:hypothetical protein